jgi:hypothetical protein
MVSFRAGAGELERCRRALTARAERERLAMREATEDLQDASDRLVHLAVTGVRLVRQFWLPASALAAGALFKRVRPVLRAARTALALWQMMRLLRDGRR